MKLTCTYESGRVCGKTATVTYISGDRSCNRHRHATETMIGEAGGDYDGIEIARHRAPAEA